MTTGCDSVDQNMSVKVGNPMIYNMPAPASYSGAITYQASDIVGGIVVHNTGGAGVNGQMPSAAAIAALLRGVGSQMQVGDTIECLIINGGTAGAITLLAGAGMSFDANQGANSQAILTANSKFINFRFTGVTPGSETCVLYS